MRGESQRAHAKAKERKRRIVNNVIGTGNLDDVSSERAVLRTLIAHDVTNVDLAIKMLNPTGYCECKVSIKNGVSERGYTRVLTSDYHVIDLGILNEKDIVTVKVSSDEKIDTVFATLIGGHYG